MATMLARSRAGVASVRAAPAARRTLVVRATAQKPSPMQQAQALIRPAAVTAVANIIMALPASAEAGKLFDFNLTLPAMVGEFLLLMVFLEKTWFTPVGKVLDERDATIRDKLASVKDNGADLEKFTKEAEEVVRAARAEVSAMVNKEKGAKQAELDAVYATAKAMVTKDVDAAIAVVEKESAALLASLDAKVDGITSDVLKRVLPAGVKV